MGNGLSSLATITQYWISDINSKWLRKFTVVLVPDMMSRLVGWILLLLVVVVCFFLWGGGRVLVFFTNEELWRRARAIN